MWQLLMWLQADDSNWVRMLPATAVSVRVSFYAATAQQLAPAHPVVQVRAQARLHCWQGMPCTDEFLNLHIWGRVQVAQISCPALRPGEP